MVIDDSDYSEHSLLHAQATLHMPQAAAYGSWLQAHLQQEGIQATCGEQPGSTRLTMPDVATLQLYAYQPDILSCDVWPVDAPMLALIKMSLLEHAQQFLVEQGLDPQTIDIQWQGNENAAAQPGFQLLRVIAVHEITPSMRRFRLQAQDMAAFIRDGLHLRLLLPSQQDTPTQWPTISADGRLQWPANAPRLPQRIYTIRQLDPQQSWLEVDMLRHASAGIQAPGAQWAESAKVNDCLGVITPAGGRLPQPKTMVMFGDCCAIPAIDRILQALPASSQVHVIALVDEAAEIQPLSTQATHCVQWICQADPVAARKQVLHALEQLSWHTLQPSLLWAGCNHQLAKDLRHWAKQAHPQLRTQISSYWR